MYHRKEVSVWRCHGQGGNQLWMWSQEDEIRRDDNCLDYLGAGAVRNMRCHGQGGHQQWSYDRVHHKITHKVTRKCLTLSENRHKLHLELCRNNDSRQEWIMNLQSL